MRERNHFTTALYKFVRHLEIRISQKFELFHFPSPSSPLPFSYTAHFVETTGNELGGVTLSPLYCSSCHDYSPSPIIPSHIRHWSCCIVVLRPVFRVMFSWANTSRKRSRTSAWHRKVLSRYIHHLSYHLTSAQSICRKVVFTALYISHCTLLTYTSSCVSLEDHAIFSINFFFTFMRWSNFIRVVSPITTVTKTPLYIVIIATEDHFQEITSLPLLSFQKEFEVAFIKVFGVIHPRTLFIALWRKAVLPLWF